MSGSPRSFWLEEALSRESGIAPEPLVGQAHADVCIVGGGFTGLWTAIFLKQREPGADIVIIEKDTCGGGASGRNGGFCRSWMSKAPTVLKLCGEQEGVWLLKQS